MSTSAIAVRGSAGQTWTRAARVVLIALAVIILFAVSFVVGRSTKHTARPAPAIVPSAGVPTGIESCRLGRPC